MIIRVYIPSCLFLAAAVAPNASAQVQATGGTVTVTMLETVDSSRPPSTPLNARLKAAVTLGNVTVPAGSNAVLKLVQAGAGNWTLTLVSLTANGQAVPVSGGSPSLAGTAGLANGASSVQSAVSGIIRGLPGRKPAPANQNTSGGATLPSVAGARVYVPTGADVQFVVNGAPAGASRGVAQSAAAPAPAAAASSPAPQTGIAPPQPGAAAVSAPAAAPVQDAAPAAASSGAVVYENIQYQLQSCKRQAPHIICEIQITNLGTNDAFLIGGNTTYYVDQAGNRQTLTQRSIANCVGLGRCDLLPNLPTMGRFEFMDQDGRATTLVRLQIWENNKAVAQFNNVAVQ